MDTLKPEFQIAQAQQMYASGNQNQRTQAIETIKSLIASNAINLSDVTAGLERPLTNEDKTKIAIEILTGRQGVGDTGVTESDIVLGIN
jgi:stage V sporulation protein SpoVS